MPQPIEITTTAPGVYARLSRSYTNAEKMRVSSAPVCEWSPERVGLARLSDTFHGRASAYIKGAGGAHLRVCAACATDQAARSWAAARLRGW